MIFNSFVEFFRNGFFGGFQNQKVVLAEAAALEAQVSTDDSVAADTGSFGDSWFVAGYDAENPITSSPLFTFDEVTGDFCMTPVVLGEVSVMQVLIEEYRSGVKIGSVERDIQLRVINCPNDNH